MVLDSLNMCIIHFPHHAELSGHAVRAVRRKHYYLIRRTFYWPYPVVYFYAVVPVSARNLIKLQKNVADLYLFPVYPPLE